MTRFIKSIRAVRGFSYVELIFSVAILALLAATATPYLEKTVQRKKEQELRTHLREIRSALDAYKAASDAGKIEKALGDSGYPRRLQDLVIGMPDMTDPKKKKLRFLRRLPVDPMYVKKAYAEDADLKAEDSWGKRSYASDAEDPKEGEDVYDVYSMSHRKGLNGIPYKQW